MKFSISSEVLTRFPKLKIGVLVAKDLDNQGASKEAGELLDTTAKAIRERLSLSELQDLPEIACWREAYSSFGGKPNKNRPSIENLCALILNGTQLRSINKVVDLYNYISLKYLLPLGGDDLDHIEGDIELCLASGKEPFQALNSNEITYPKPGEIIYKDNKDVLCRRWNWRECNKSKLTESSKNVCLVIEDLSNILEDKFTEVLRELSTLISKFCGGKHSYSILSAEKSSTELLSMLKI